LVADDNKFGQKLLEKMGWKKGSALGLMEDGNPEPIKVTAKSDRRGITRKLYFIIDILL